MPAVQLGASVTGLLLPALSADTVSNIVQAGGYIFSIPGIFAAALANQEQLRSPSITRVHVPALAAVGPAAAAEGGQPGGIPDAFMALGLNAEPEWGGSALSSLLSFRCMAAPQPPLPV